MFGNVWEWCADEWDEKAYHGRETGVVDPFVEPEGEGAWRVVRGGSWNDRARLCRSAYRGRGDPGSRVNILGFRLAAGQEPGAAERPG